MGIHRIVQVGDIGTAADGLRQIEIGGPVLSRDGADGLTEQGGNNASGKCFQRSNAACARSGTNTTMNGTPFACV